MISPANFLAIADNIAKTLLDLESAYIANPTINTPTVATITLGQTGISNSLESRIANLGNIQQEADLAAPAYQTANTVITYCEIMPSQFYALYIPLIIALDLHTSGVNAFLASNNIEVHPEFANAFNYVAANAALLGLVIKAITPIATSHVFAPVTQNLGAITITGAAGGNFTPGITIDTTKYAAGQFYLQNSGAGVTSGTSTSLLITYVDGSGATQTAPISLSGALGAGGTLIVPGAIGSAISGISVTSNGVNGDQFSIISPPIRSVTY